MKGLRFFLCLTLLILPLVLVGEGVWLPPFPGVRALLASLMYAAFVAFCLCHFVNQTKRRHERTTKAFHLLKCLAFYVLLAFVWLSYIVIMALVTTSLFGLPSDLH